MDGIAVLEAEGLGGLPHDYLRLALLQVLLQFLKLRPMLYRLLHSPRARMSPLAD